MLLAAEFGSGQVLWSFFWFFIFFVWIMLLFTVFGDIFRSDDLSGLAKAIWIVFVIFLPYLGIFVYLIARGNSMAERRAEAYQEQDQAARAYIRDAASSASPADQLASLAELHNSGKLTDEEFATAKANVIGG
jgi:hypothetical protein